MRKLLLIRHAKATHESGYSDFERPLTDKGFKQCEIMTARVLKNNIKPDIVVASPALRTVSTANIFTQELGLATANTDYEIYEASENTLLKVIYNLPDKDFVALVGHNPAISQVLTILSGEYKDMSTCAVALLEFDADNWMELHEGSGKIAWFDSPKED